MTTGSVAQQRIRRGTSDVSTVVAEESDAGIWDAFVDTCPDAAAYHSWGWRGVFERAFGHTCVYLIARSGNSVCGVLPLVQINSLLFGRTLTSLPFVNYGGVLAGEEPAAEQLMSAAAEEARARRCQHVELRHVARRFPSLPCRQHKVTMLLRLAGVDWSSLDKKVRNQIRKAEKSGLAIQSGHVEMLDEFYAVFARNMRDLGTPVYDRQLFGEVLRTFPERARLHVVRLGTTPVAAGLTLRGRSRLEMPWASSIREYNSLCPNHLLYWTAIQHARDSGCEVFDFGRSTPDSGPYRFKAQWGASPIPLHWHYWVRGNSSPPELNPNNPKYRLAIKVWQHLPVSLTRLIGPSIVKNLP